MGWYNIANGVVASGSTTFAVNFGSGTGSPQFPAVGDLIVIVVNNSSGDTVSSVADSQGQAYTALVSAGGSNQRATLYGLINAKTFTGSDTITATYSATGGSKFIIAKGLDGAASATVDKSSTGGTTGTAASSGATATLTQAAEAVIGAFQNAAATQSAPSFGSLLTLTSGSSAGEIDELVNATTAQTASCTLSASVLWSALVATFKLTAPGITTSSPLPAGITGLGYSQALAESGGTRNFTWSQTGGSLSGSGLSLSSAGVVSGTCGTPGTYNFTAQVQDGAGQTASKPLSVTVFTRSYLPGGPQPDPDSVLGYSNGTALNGVLAYAGASPEHLPPAGSLGAVAVLYETGAPGAQATVTEQAVIQ